MADALFSLENETACVIGGTGALGGALAEALAAAGARVAIMGREPQRGAELVERIKSTGRQAMFVAGDALDRDSLVIALDTIVRRWDAPGILLNAAGGNRPAATLAAGDDFCRLPLDAWQEVFDLNLVAGALLPCQVFGAPMLAAGRGSIINIASMAAITPLSRVPAYSAAKAAVLNLTRFLAREWALRGVRVNAISPGFFPGEQNRALLFNPDGSPTDRGRQIIGHTPMARLGEAQELAGAVVWLAAQRASSFVTGQNIVIDGGFSAMTV